MKTEFFSKWYTLTLFLILSACGGHQQTAGTAVQDSATTTLTTSTPIDPANPTLSAGIVVVAPTGTSSVKILPKKTLTIGMYGDSTMYGSTCSSRDGNNACVYTVAAKNEPASLLKMLSDTFPNANFVIRNHGVGGSKASDWIYNDGTVKSIGPNATFAQMMADPRYADEQIVLMNVAINDAFTLNVAPSLYTTNANVLMLTNDLFKSYYSQFHQAASAHGKLFVIDGPNPLTDAGHDPVLLQLVQDQRSVAQSERLNYVDQYAAIQAFVPLWRTMLPDGVHPNDDLYAIKGYNVLNALRAVFASYL